MNVLILRGVILIHDDIGMVTYEDLMAHVRAGFDDDSLRLWRGAHRNTPRDSSGRRGNQVVELLERPLSEHATPEEVANRQQNLEDVRAILPLLEAGLDVNVKFTRCDTRQPALCPRG